MSPEVAAPGPGRLDVVLAEALGVPRADVQRAITSAVTSPPGLKSR